MTTVNIYLNFSGNTEEAFNFYKSVFGTEFTGVHRFKETPEAENMSAEDKEKIMHISLNIGNNMLMGTDVLESMGQKLVVGNNFYISLHVESKEEADRLFAELSEEGKIEMQIGDSPWGSYFGMFADKFGVQWMVSYEYPRS